MKELYLIMGELLEAEYNQKSLLYILETMESLYSEETHAEAKLIVNGITYSMKNQQKELRAIINHFDSYIVEEANKQ